VRALWKGLTPFATHLTCKYALRMGSNSVYQVRNQLQQPLRGSYSKQQDAPLRSTAAAIAATAASTFACVDAQCVVCPAADGCLAAVAIVTRRPVTATGCIVRGNRRQPCLTRRMTSVHHRRMQPPVCLPTTPLPPSLLPPGPPAGQGGQADRWAAHGGRLHGGWVPSGCQQPARVHAVDERPGSIAGSSQE
jgi:hypothetical protein